MNKTKQNEVRQAFLTLNSVGQIYSLEPKILLSKNESRAVTTARYAAMRILFELHRWNLTRIATLFKTDHTNVKKSIEKCRQRTKQSAKSRELYQRLRSQNLWSQ